MKGFRFTKFIPTLDPEKNRFESLLDIFLQLVTMTGGDVSVPTMASATSLKTSNPKDTSVRKTRKANLKLLARQSKPSEKAP
jgi:hypothetical protein